MAELVFTTRGTAQVLAEQEKIAQQQGKQKTLAKELSAEYAKNDAELKKLGRTAQQIYLANETAQERYNRKLAEAKAALQGNVNEVELLKRAETQLKLEYARSADANQKLAEQRKRTAADSLALEKNIAAEVAKTTAATKTAGSVLGTIFDPQKLVAYAAGFLGIGTAVAGVTKYFREMEQAAQQAADRSLNAIGALGELQQVSTSDKDFQNLVGQARGLVSSGVYSPDQLGSAADLVFALRNALYTDDEVQFITGLGKSKQVKPENMQKLAEGLKKYQLIFGKKEAGSIDQVSQKVFAAAGTMQTDFAKAAESATLFGSEAAALGFSDEEALAAFVAIEQRSPGPEEAATRLRSLLTQITKDGLAEKTLKETLAKLAARIRKGEKAIDITGEIRAAAGLNILAGEGGYQTFLDQEKSLTAAQNSDLIGTSRYAANDPEMRAGIARQRAAGKLSQGRAKRSSTIESLYDAYRDEVLERLESQGRYGAAFAEKIGLGLTDALGLEATDLREMAFAKNAGISPELQSDLQDYFIKQAQSPEDRKFLEDLVKKTNSLLSDQLKQQEETNRQLRKQQGGGLRVGSS